MRKKPELNIPMLDKVMDHIKADQEHWNQAAYRCDLTTNPEKPSYSWQTFAGIATRDRIAAGEVLPIDCNTAFCFAGWACELDSHPDAAKWVSSSELFRTDEDGPPCGHDPNPGTVYAHDRAQRLLGLTEEQADDLFEAGNSLDMLERQVACLKEGRDWEDEEEIF